MSASSSDSPNGTAVFIDGHARPLANYPHARRVGDLLFVSGCSARRADDTHAGVDIAADGTVTLDIRAQTRGVIENLRQVLREAGGDLENLVDVTAFLVRMEHYSGFNAVYDEYFDAATGPARTTVAVSELPHPHLLVEIKAIAAI